MQKLIYWCALAFAITMTSFLIYWAGQQNLRQGAYDSQIQLSEDLANEFSTNPNLDLPSPYIPIDISKSLATFVIIYDKDGKAVKATAKLNDEIPVIPQGSLEYAKEHDQNRLSWEPQKGVRLATVITHFKVGNDDRYVLVARSMREVESRINRLLFFVGVSWLTSLVGSFIILMLGEKVSRLVKKN